MAIKSTKKVLVSVLSFAVFSQPFCGAKDFIENKNIPQKSIVIKKEKPTVFNKIKEFAKKHPVKAAVGGVVGLGTVIIVGGIIVKNALFGDKNILTAEDVINRNSKKFKLTFDGVLTINKGITTIDLCAFKGRTSLTKVIIPNSVTTICADAFSGCISLTKVIIPKSVKEIGAEAFWGCTSLREVTIPKSVKEIGGEAFCGCGSLKKVNFEESSQLAEINYGVFSNCKKLSEITIPNSVTTIGEDAFCSCTSLNSVTIPNSVKTIDANAFWNTSLKNVTIPSNCGYVKEGRPRSFPEGCVVTPKQMK